MAGVISEIASLSLYVQQLLRLGQAPAKPAMAQEELSPFVPRPQSWIDTIDITNDYLVGLPKNITDTYRLATNEHLAIGIYLVASGIVVGIANMIGILAFVRFPRALLTPSAIPEVALMVSDLGVGGIHPYSGASALANRWLWGPGGCQLYSISGFIFGDLQVVLVNFVAFDRFVTVCRPKWGEKVRSFKSYFRILFACFVLAAVFTVLPLLGFGSFGMIPTKIVCTLNYMQPNQNFSAYLTAKLICLCGIPQAIGVLSTMKACRRLGQDNPPAIHFANQHGYSKVLWASLLVTPICFSPYAVVAVWALAQGPTFIPRGLIPLPPLSAKLAGLFNPLIYMYANPLVWSCVRATLGLTHDDRLIVEVEEENEAEEERREARKVRLQQLEEAQEMVAPHKAPPAHR